MNVVGFPRALDVQPRFRLERARVAERLDSAMQHPVAVLSAPAGYGKTLAVEGMLETRARVAWCVVPESCDSLLALLRVIAAAIDPFVGGVHLSLAVAYERAGSSPTATRELALWLRAHVDERQVTIVIDGAEQLASADLRRAVSSMVDATHDVARWVFTTRDTATLPLSAWLARRWCALPIDERVLAFTAEEARACARIRGSLRSDEEIARFVAATRGRPSTIALALNRRLDERALHELLDGELDPDRSLVRALFETLPPRTQRSLVELAVLETLDPQTLAYVPDLAEDVHAALAAAPELFRQRGASIGLSPALAELLAVERAKTEARDDGTLHRLTSALERAGRVVDARRLFQRRGAREAALALLERCGLRFIEAGESSILVEATSFLREPGAAAETPVVLALRALAEAQQRRADTADYYFRLALQHAAEPGTRLELAYRYGLYLMRGERTEAAEVIERALATVAPGEEPRPALFATLATAYARDGRHRDADDALRTALEALEREPSLAARARVCHQAAFCAVWAERYDDAVAHARRAGELARECGAHDVAARAAHLLYFVALEVRHDPRAALAHLDDYSRYGLLAGDAEMRYKALASALDIHAELGDLERFERVEDALEAPEFADFSGDTLSTLVPAQALRAAWAGGFADAYALVAGTAEGEPRPARRALRHAEIALHAAAAGKRSEAADALTASAAVLAAGGIERSAIARPRALAALAAAILGERDYAPALVDAVLELAADAQSLALARAARGFLAYAERGPSALREALDDLWAADLGGFARFVEALPRALLGAPPEPEREAVPAGVSDARD